MRRLMVWVVAVLALAAVGCGFKVITVDLKQYPGPVMIGPVMRIGDEVRPGPESPAFGSFKGERMQSIVSGQNQYRQGNYIVTETRTTTTKSDDIGYSIMSAAQSRRDLLVVVDELEAGSWMHLSLMALGYDWVKMTGKLYDPKTVEWRKQK